MTTSSLLNSAESWEKVYKAFEQVNFTAYDFDAVKQSLLDYLKLYYPENFNDYIESSQFIALVELFAYVAELFAYRVDMSVHENMLPTASRKQSILRLVKLISYTASRNLPLRGLVKINTVSISEDVVDSQGNSLANRIIKWDDQNNPLWREQFFAVMNKVMTKQYGAPLKTFQIDDTLFQQYEVKNVIETESDRSSFTNGVFRFDVVVNGNNVPFELVPADVDQDGVYERDPNLNSYFNILFADDGYGDSSDTTGFMMYLKQGTLQKIPYIFDINLPNRVLDLNLPNVNDVDVWVQQVDAQGVLIEQWENVPNVAGVNLAFNNIQNMNKYEIETLENDKIRLIFGDGDFATIPTGIFNIWVRQSTSGNLTVPKTLISDQAFTFLYTSKTGQEESCTVTYSLVTALQNSATSEDPEHIRSVAPSVYYTQNRMVNGQDYNSFFLKDPSILRLRSVNRTFAGQPKYLNWNDASGAYQNVKIFGDDLRMYYDLGGQGSVTTVSARSLIDEVLEPALESPGIYNLMIYAYYTNPLKASISTTAGIKNITVRPFVRPRTKFIEDVTQTIGGVPLLEKTSIQGALDRHWYGEPDSRIQLDVNLSEISNLPKTVYAIVNGDTDHRIYDSNIKCVTKDYLTGVYSLIPTPGGTSGIQEFSIRQKRFGISFNPTRAFCSNLKINSFTTSISSFPETDNLSVSDVDQSMATDGEVYTIEIIDENGTFSVHSSISGMLPPGMVGEAYTNGVISFLIAFPGDQATGQLVLGDAFVVSINRQVTGLAPTVLKCNLNGSFTLVDEPNLPEDLLDLTYSTVSTANSWIFIVERVDDSDGNVAYWNVVRRDFNLVVESPTTKFWYNSETSLVDPDTKKPVYDMIRILKSNLNSTGTNAVGVDQIYNVVGNVKYSNGEVNFNALSVAPSTVFDVIDTSTTGTSVDPIQFLNFIGSTDYVYFSVDSTTGMLNPIPRTAYLDSLTYINGKADNYVRKIGRDNLDFMWQHFTPQDNLIDPSTSNIIDAYILTRGYYSQVMDYISGRVAVMPTPPTSLDLRNSYRKMIESKMISDTVVMHSGTVKLLFGEKAVPELRAKFRVVQASDSKMTGDQIRMRVLEIIDDYFKIDNWDFGQSFYATELCAVIHQQLSTEIASVVLVPIFPTNYFGDLFYLRSTPNEVFASCADLVNIELVSSIDRLTLKQKQ